MPEDSRTRISARAVEPHLVRNRRSRRHRGTADSDRGRLALARSAWSAHRGRADDPERVAVRRRVVCRWENAPVLGELVFHAFYATLSDRGLVLAQVAAVVGAFVFLARDMRAAALGTPLAASSSCHTARGRSCAVGGPRAALLSALFPLLVLLLRSQTRAPSWRIWLIVPLVALWSNLHGAVLVGVGVSAAYLLLHRMRQQPAVAVGVLSPRWPRSSRPGAPGHGRLLPRRADG